MRAAMYVGVAAYALATLSALVATRAGPAGYIAAALLYASVTVAYVAFAAGLWRFRSVPASTGAARLARQSFVCAVVRLVPWSLFLLFSVWDAAGLGTVGRWVGDHIVAPSLMLWPITSIAMSGACLWILVRALGAVLGELGEKLPAWAPRAVGWYVAWTILSTALIYLRVATGDASSVVHQLTIVADCVIALALASLLRRAAMVLARQESLGTALR